MQRRTLLRLSLLGGVFLWGARPSNALGGLQLQLNEPAPSFDLPGTSRLEPSRQRWKLEDFRGRWLVLYFYPRDFTSGCTLEAHGFQNRIDDFRAIDSDVAAVSADGLEAHTSFCSSEELDFALLSDPDGAVSKRYGSWMAPYSLRHTFLIDPNGLLKRIWTGVRPAGHASEVLATLTALKAASPV